MNMGLGRVGFMKDNEKNMDDVGVVLMSLSSSSLLFESEVLDIISNGRITVV